MNLICKITDEDVGEKSVNMDNPRLRLGARGIVIREDGKIAIFNKSNKNEYKLPGGGIEGTEKPEEAFKREVLEETGCKIEIIKYLGTTEEYKTLDNFKQISYVFVSRVLEDTKRLNLTQKEKDEGAKLLWETPENGLKLITNSFDNLVASKYESVYHTKFVVLRDKKILEEYLRNQKIKYRYDFFIAGRARNKENILKICDLFDKYNVSYYCFLKNEDSWGYGNSTQTPEERQKEFESLNLKSDVVLKLFNDDLNGERNSKNLLLVLPAGKAAHIEAGIMYGLGRKCYAIGEHETTDTLYNIFENIFLNENELKNFLKRY